MRAGRRAAQHAPHGPVRRRRSGYERWPPGVGDRGQGSRDWTSRSCKHNCDTKCAAADVPSGWAGLESVEAPNIYTPAAQCHMALAGNARCLRLNRCIRRRSCRQGINGIHAMASQHVGKCPHLALKYAWRHRLPPNFGPPPASPLASTRPRPHPFEGQSKRMRNEPAGRKQQLQLLKRHLLAGPLAPLDGKSSRMLVRAQRICAQCALLHHTTSDKFYDCKRMLYLGDHHITCVDAPLAASSSCCCSDGICYSVLGRPWMGVISHAGQGYCGSGILRKKVHCCATRVAIARGCKRMLYLWRP